jgi:hypothetical protein
MCPEPSGLKDGPHSNSQPRSTDLACVDQERSLLQSVMAAPWQPFLAAPISQGQAQVSQFSVILLPYPQTDQNIKAQKNTL